MRVHDEIRSPPGLRKGHVLLIDNKSANTLLSMSAGKLVTQFGSPHFPDNGFDDLGRLLICSHNDLIDVVVDTGRLEYRRLVIPRYLSAIDTNDLDLILDLL